MHGNDEQAAQPQGAKLVGKGGEASLVEGPNRERFARAWAALTVGGERDAERTGERSTQPRMGEHLRAALLILPVREQSDQ